MLAAMTHTTIWLILLTAAALVGCAPQRASTEPMTRAAVDADQRAAAQAILADPRLADVTARADELLRTGFNAGGGYPEVWIRDFATFVGPSLGVNDSTDIRESLLRIARFQRPDGNIPDGYTPGAPDPALLAEARQSDELVTRDIGWREVIVHPQIDDSVGFKNSVETDQESSLVLAVATYVDVTGDRGILDADVDGTPLRERLVAALDFLRRDRWDEAHGLVWGGTTIDWGDIAPEDNPGAVLRDDSHRAIDVYDNALFMLAIDALVPLLDDEAAAAEWRDVRETVKANVRKHLWDAEKSKFRTHIYLSESPFPAEFDEEAIWYFGGTAVAIQAGILDDAEAKAAVEKLQNIADEAGAITLGITNYPHYPVEYFANKRLVPGAYQNGGDWDWFGGRFVQALVDRGDGATAYALLSPMLDRVQRHDGFFEWFDAQDRPQGSDKFRGSAGVLAEAIDKLQRWAETHAEPQTGES